MALIINGLVPLLQVFDMARSVQFYTELLGFENVETSRPDGDHYDFCLLRNGDTAIMLNTAYERQHRPDVEPARSNDPRTISLYLSCPDVDEAYRHLSSRAWAVDPPVDTDYGMRQLYVKDPDGYLLCFQHPTDGSGIS